MWFRKRKARKCTARAVVGRIRSHWPTGIAASSGAALHPKNDGNIPVMRARVHVLRLAGRVREPDDIEPPVEGNLLTHCLVDEHGNVATLEVIGNQLPDNELLPRLYHARLISINGGEWRLRGLERLRDGREVLQEWVCRFPTSVL